MSLSTDLNEKIIKSLEKFSLDIPKRPPCGTKGVVKSFITNYFSISFDFDSFFHYTVDFDPPIEESSTQHRRNLIFGTFGAEIRKRLSNAIFFDNTLLYSLYKVAEPMSFIDSSRKQSLTIQLANDFSLKSIKSYEMASQIFHVMLRRLISEIGYFRSGPKFFSDDKRNVIDVSAGGETISLWKGFSISMELVKKGFVVKIDPVHRVVYRNNMREILREERKRYRGKNFDRYVKEHYGGLCIITRYNKRVYRISSYDSSFNPQDKFYWDEISSEISFENYMRQNYNTALRYHQEKGMLIHYPNKGVLRGKALYLIPELCYLTGISRKMKENHVFSRALAKETTSNPRQRMEKSRLMIRSLVKRQKEIDENAGDAFSVEGDIARDFMNEKIPLKINTKEIIVKGRVLPHQMVRLNRLTGRREYLSEIKAIPDLKKQWTNAKFVNLKENDKSLKDWVVIAAKHDERLQRSFVEQAKDISLNMGKVIKNSPRETILVQTRNNSYFNDWKCQLQTVAERSDMKNNVFFVVVLPNHDASTLIYNFLKELFIGIGAKSQCIKVENLKNKSYQAIKGTLKQMMAKINNRLWLPSKSELSESTLEMLKRPTIVVGIDVCHNWLSSQSTVGICISYDEHFTHYWSYVVKQKITQEIVHKLRWVFCHAICRYRKKHRRWVEQILVFRDGVSDSQIEGVVREEVAEILSAVKDIKRKHGEVAAGLNPLLTFIVVQKRVSLRLATRDFKSVPAGTVIDDTIVSRKFWDFYLIPHEPPFASREKTANPSRYIVVHDDLGFDSDNIQLFSRYLCLCYYNFPAPVKVPAPIKYADRLAMLFSPFESLKQPEEKISDTLFML